MAKAESSYQKAKSVVTRRGSTLSDLKEELRKQFNSRLKDMRRRSLDSHRKITAGDIKQGYHELADTLQSEIHEFDLIKPDEVFNVLKAIQDELVEEVLNEEVQEFERFFADEIQATVESLFTCKVCEISSEKDICDSCSSKHFSDVIHMK